MQFLLRFDSDLQNLILLPILTQTAQYISNQKYSKALIKVSQIVSSNIPNTLYKSAFKEVVDISYDLFVNRNSINFDWNIGFFLFCLGSSLHTLKLGCEEVILLWRKTWNYSTAVQKFPNSFGLLLTSFLLSDHNSLKMLSIEFCS